MARPRLPTQLKVLKGTLQPCRTNPAEPKAPVLTTVPFPPHLPETHREHWDRIVEAASHLRCVTKADVPAIEQMVGVAVEVDKLVKTRKSSVKCRKVLFDMLGKFGMTPSERSKVSALPEEKEDRLAKFKTYPGKG